ncbi:DNA methyltransferase [Sphingomonas sp. MMS24-JH45]
MWDKGSGGMGGLWRSTHEFVLVFAAGKKIATNNVALGRHGRDRCNVWRYPGANKQGSSAAKALKLHATPKPVPMVEDAICDVIHRGDIVLDPFLGSGRRSWRTRPVASGARSSSIPRSSTWRSAGSWTSRGSRRCTWQAVHLLETGAES